MIQVNPILKEILEKSELIDSYVILKRDEQGEYIEYAFKEGAPHDNRCIDWYHSYQEEAYIRNGWADGAIKYRKEMIDSYIGKIFSLYSFDCGYSNEEGDDHCSPGHPKKSCLECTCRHWTYKQPVKCACWHLGETREIYDIEVTLTLGKLSELIKE